MSRTYLLTGLACLVAVIIGSIVLYRALPGERTIRFRFTTRPDVGAEILVNGERVGRAPLALAFDEIRKRFLPGFEPGEWPPPGTAASATIRDDALTLEVFVARPPEGEKDSLVYLRRRAGGDWIEGVLRVRAETPDGRVGRAAGAGFENRKSFKRVTSELAVTFFFEGTGNP